MIMKMKKNHLELKELKNLKILQKKKNVAIQINKIIFEIIFSVSKLLL